ncbi:aldehyde dehydrogenase family protein [Rhodococcus pseudokoreensis]|uniref:Aldehyde dehydrogenase family protein n=1 Tax=Rhodococcus pseudokoreensis TaxID=2811421 RepID=A0A974W6P3_9NOCA|nr:aldehyde dehydrogenase family protein [Rhodococcus pseudokoreensis]QSE92264.1 aldehyde dehydrogenase family protein [Rhodococcus pseudokoreensis]
MSNTPASATLLEDAATLFIDGEWCTSEQTYNRFEPYETGHLSGIFASATPAHVRRAYDAAEKAQPGWAAIPAVQRADVLRRAADLLEARVETAARRLTADMGKAIRDARGEVLRSAAILRYYAGDLLQPSGETYPSADPETVLLTVEQPLGIVCAITPWNFPFAIPTWKIAPAVAFGNSVVWKPAEGASGSAVLLTEIFAEAGLPTGVLNLITGKGRSLSGSLTGDNRLAALTFTGSNGVGVRLREAVADRNVKVQLELGGKNPAIVLADAELEDAAVQVVRGAMLAAGQRCTATSRVYVQRQVATEFRELLLAQVNRLVVGNPYDEATDIGPMSSPEQRDTVVEYLRLAHEEGADILLGGKADGEGCFLEPTVLTGVAPSSRLVREEIFGPVLVLTEVEDFDEALAAANDTVFGLSASLFTSNISKAMQFVRRINSGLVHVNRETASVEPHVPFGGVKASSSMNREQGKAARTFFTTTKTVYLRSPN